MKVIVSLIVSLVAGWLASAPQEALRPSAEHALIQKYAGHWEAVIVGHDPSGKETRTKATLVREKIGDYHTADRFEGELMGMKFQGRGMNGYCAVKKEYFTLWTDSMSPSPLVLNGRYDEKTRELKMTGQCYGMSGKLEPCRAVTRFVDDDHFSFTLYGAGPDGKETQHLSVEYARKR